jgi:hypothetical protein
VDLTDGAVVNSVLGSVQLAAGELAWPDAVRCLPGFCLFATTTAGSTPTSAVYRISTKDASVVYRVAVPGTCAHMHADFQTGHAYTLCTAGATTAVVEVTGSAPVTVADITAAVGGGATLPGQTTHCSATQSMYVGVSHGGAGKDAIVSVDLTAGRVSGSVTLASPLSRTLWATCDGSGVVGGLDFAPGAAAGAPGNATFGTFDAAGRFKVDSSVAVPPGLVPSGLLTATSPATYQDAFLGAFYPDGTLPNSTTASGVLWAVDPYGGGSDDFTSPVGFVLIGAAWDRE